MLTQRSLDVYINAILQNADRKLRNNAFSGQLDMSRNISLQLQLTDLQDNDILSVTLSSENNTTLL